MIHITWKKSTQLLLLYRRRPVEWIVFRGNSEKRLEILAFCWPGEEKTWCFSHWFVNTAECKGKVKERWILTVRLLQQGPYVTTLLAHPLTTSSSNSLGLRAFAGCSRALSLHLTQPGRARQVACKQPSTDDARQLVGKYPSFLAHGQGTSEVFTHRLQRACWAWPGLTCPDRAPCTGFCSCLTFYFSASILESFFPLNTCRRVCFLRDTNLRQDPSTIYLLLSVTMCRTPVACLLAHQAWNKLRSLPEVVSDTKT